MNEQKIVNKTIQVKNVEELNGGHLTTDELINVEVLKIELVDTSNICLINNRYYISLDLVTELVEEVERYEERLNNGILEVISKLKADVKICKETRVMGSQFIYFAIPNDDAPITLGDNSGSAFFLNTVKKAQYRYYKAKPSEYVYRYTCNWKTDLDLMFETIKYQIKKDIKSRVLLTINDQKIVGVFSGVFSGTTDMLYKEVDHGRKEEIRLYYSAVDKDEDIIEITEEEYRGI
jgi:hypothetical protein